MIGKKQLGLCLAVLTSCLLLQGQSERGTITGAVTDSTGAVIPNAKVVVTHAEFPSQNLTGDEQKELADLGAIIEHCFTTTYTGKATWEAAFANIRKTGVSRTMISTDLGQTINPPVAEGFAMFAQRLLDAGFSVDDVRTMAVTIPTRLVED